LRAFPRPFTATLIFLALTFAISLPLAAQQTPPRTRRLPDPNQQVTLPAQELQSLYQRLDAAEQRIQQIETRRLPPVHEASIYDTDNGIVPNRDEGLAERIEALEKEFNQQADDAAKKKAAGAKSPTHKWTGRTQADYWAFPNTSPGANAFENIIGTDPVADRFLFRRIRFGMAGEIPDQMIYKAEFDLNNPSRPQLKDVYLGWNDLPVFQTLLVGNQKRPYGLDALDSSRYTIFMERPLVVDAFTQDSRRFGICSYGVSDDIAYNWRFGSFLSQDLQNAGQDLAVDGDYQAEAAGRFANTLWYDDVSDGRNYAHWAVAGTVGSAAPAGEINSVARWRSRPEARTTNRWLDTGPIAGADSYQLLGVEGLVNLGPLQLCGEYMHMVTQREHDSTLNFSGGYFYLSYFLTGEHMAWDRESGTLDRVKPFQNFLFVRGSDDVRQRGCGAWQLAVRYSQGDFTDDNIAGGVGESVTFGLNWYWNPHAKLQLNYLYGSIDNRSPDDGYTAGTYSILGTRFMVDY
jgi:phosphate-selective porin OprO/OprP